MEQPLRSAPASGDTVAAGSRLARQVVRALEGAVYPLEREALLWVARENDSPREMMTALARLPPGPFTSVEQVLALMEEPAPGAPADS